VTLMPTSLPSVAGLTPSSASDAGGTNVVIAGSGFSGATAVNFGDVAAASFTVDSDGQITAVAPQHADGAVDVVVTTPAGPSPRTAADAFTFVAPATGGDNGGGANPGATPELDSLLLLASGFSSLAGYALLRVRTRRR
jgi:hypothetical protein